VSDCEKGRPTTFSSDIDRRLFAHFRHFFCHFVIFIFVDFVDFVTFVGFNRFPTVAVTVCSVVASNRRWLSRLETDV